VHDLARVRQHLQESLSLDILFADGRVYQYLDVPESAYQWLINAASVGRYFQDNVRGVYRYARV
jgi:KTSC domain